MVLGASITIFLLLRTYQYPQVKSEVINKWLESASKPEIEKYVNDYRAGYFALRDQLLTLAEGALAYSLANVLIFMVESMRKKNRSKATES